MLEFDNEKRLLAYYLRHAFIEAGLTWTPGNEAEVNGIVNGLTQRLKLDYDRKIDALEGEINELKATLQSDERLRLIEARLNKLEG